MKQKILILLVVITLMLIIVPANEAIFKWLGMSETLHGMELDSQTRTACESVFDVDFMVQERMVGNE